MLYDKRTGDLHVSGSKIGRPKFPITITYLERSEFLDGGAQEADELSVEVIQIMHVLV